MNGKLLKTMLAAVIAGLGLASCSDDESKSLTPPSYLTPNKADVTVLYYSLGGGDLDVATEVDILSAAYEMANSTRNVRYFVQHKYTGEKAYSDNFKKQRSKKPEYNYVQSGDFGGVYRFEMTWNMANPQLINNFQDPNFDFETTGFPLMVGLEDCKIAGADFKMYAPGNLTDFIRWGMQQAPESKAFVLCIGDHGGGYNVTSDYDKKHLTKGILYDDNINLPDDSRVCMTPQEIADALRGLSDGERSRLKILCFDACMMNNLETLSEFQGLVPYIIASAHSTSGGDQGLFVQRMGQSEGDLKEMADAAASYVKDVTKKKKEACIREGKKDPLGLSMDYTLTDMSKFDALIASVKDVREFLTEDDNKATLTEKKAEYGKAARECYQFFSAAPFYDVADYVGKLKDYVFPDNDEFKTLAANVKTAAQAAMRGHGDYSFAVDPDNGVNNLGISYSITLGCTTEALSFDAALGTIEKQGAIIFCPKTGAGTANDKYDRAITLENGDCYYHSWMKGESYDGKTFDKKAGSSASYKSWAETYCKTAFDKATGWSRWMRINPGMPLNNPPLSDKIEPENADWMDEDL